MDPTTLVLQVMAVITPVLPYLADAGKAIAEEIAGKIGEDAYERGKTLFNAIRARFAQEPDGKASKALQAWVDDPDLSSTVEVKLLRVIQQDPVFAGMLLHLIQGGPRMVIDASDEAAVRRNYMQNEQQRGSQEIIARGKSLVEENQMNIKKE